MPTTKVRKATPMRNKMALWRRMAKKTYEGTREIRNGRSIAAQLRGFNHKPMMLPIHLFLMKSAGIPTPEFDKMLEASYNGTDEVTDISPEEETNAAPA